MVDGVHDNGQRNEVDLPQLKHVLRWNGSTELPRYFTVFYNTCAVKVKPEIRPIA